VNDAADGARTVRIEVEIGRPLERLRADRNIEDVVDREDAHVGPGMVVTDQIYSPVRDDEAVRIDAALRPHAVLVSVVELHAPAFALGALELLEDAFDGRIHRNGLEADRQRRIGHRDLGAPVAGAQQLLRRLLDRGRERSAQRRAEALEGHQAEELAVREVEAPQAVPLGEPVAPGGPVEEPGEARVGQHAEIAP